MTDIARVTVIGAGVMGHGIAQVAAAAGYATRLTDARAEALAPARARIERNLAGAVARGKLTEDGARETLARLVVSERLDDAAADADLVVEAIVEDLTAKQALFRRLDALVPAHAILATNTSALSVARIATATPNPGRVVGMHFFNPVHIMKLVEVVVHPGTNAAVTACAQAVARRLGKEPIVVRDTPGFASSRLGVVLGLEAMRMVEQDVATPADIDKAMELGYGHPMGPLRVSDLVGLDVRLAIAEHLHRELGAAHYAPPAILRDKVRAGDLGKKSGKGFYTWEPTKSS